MDTSKQLYESDATGWQRGLYESITETFRAPIINWIFRTTVANHPEFVRYMWGQVSPVFRTEAFARFTINYRDAVLAAVETDLSIPVYRPEQLPIGPADYHQLRGQLETFDVVGPRLAVLFSLLDRSLSGEPVGSNVPDDPATLSPFPAHIDRDRGIPPTMAAFDQAPAGLEGTVEEIQAFHDIDEGLPSIYRCLVQWPGYLDTVWADLAPLREDDAFDPVSEAARGAVRAFLASVPHQPRLSPAALRSAGFEEAVIEDVTGLFAEFNGAIADTVLPVLHVYAATVGVEGKRTL